MLAQPDHFGPRLFRTSQLPHAQRFAAWRDVVNGWLLPVDMRPVSDRPFEGSACLRVLPGLRFGGGSLGGTLNTRTRRIAAQDNDDLFLFINTGGTFAVSQCGREVEIPVGGAFLMSCAEAGAYNWTEGMRLLALRTPAEPVSARIHNLYGSVAKAVAPDNEGLRLLTAYLRLLSDAEPFVTTEARELVTQHVQDLLALVLGATGDGGELARGRGMQAARWEMVTAYVERNLERPDLSPAAAAFHLRLSERTVQRLFERKGTSFTEHLLARRLAKAHAMLGNPNKNSERIGEVALSCGFGNVSYFNRCFRSRYGATPSDIRAAILIGH